MMSKTQSQAGIGLIELVISIVIISIAASAVLGLIASTTARSADSVLLRQSIAIATAHLEEISARPIVDPDGADGEAARSLFDDVDDYAALVASPVADTTGAPIPGLSDYRVTVVVANADLPSVSAGEGVRVDVQVTHPAVADVRLSRYVMSW